MLPWAVLLSITFLVGYMLGVVIEPDLDQTGITTSEWRALRGGKVIGGLLVIWFLPYSLIFPHRSFLSHFPFVSTLIRLLWISWPLLALIWWNDWFSWWMAEAFVGLLSGLCLSDTIHFLADQMMKQDGTWKR